MQTKSSEKVGGVVFAALVPHAPILVPPLGGQGQKPAARTVTAIEELATRLLAVRPDVIAVISPHGPRRPGIFGVWSGERLRGSFKEFGADQIALELSNDSALATEVEVQARRLGLKTWRIHDRALDHGALVPLWFLANAGWAGPIVVLSLNFPGEGGLAELGQALAEAGRRLGRRIAIIASGDMSHRLSREAPAGYDPRASKADREVIQCLRRGAYHELEQLDPELLLAAGEDAVDSMLVAAAAGSWAATAHEVLSYEGPFGVGYGVAVLFDSEQAGTALAEPKLSKRCRQAWARLPRIARESLRAALFGTPEPAVPRAELCFKVRRGVFVTVRDDEGQLRGCVGSITPVYADLVEETRHQARAAALHDGRFPPVTPEEFPHLALEVSVIEALEEVRGEEQLDPARYGVVVSTPDGRSGCLLPAIAEIATVEEQLAMAREKGGIAPGEACCLQRFAACRFREVGDGLRSVRAPSLIGSEAKGERGLCRWWTMLEDGRIECQLCPRFCRLQEGQRGFCFGRQRLENRMVLTTYGRSSGLWIDPIEKKPLNHFYPGTSVLSFGTVGCNLGCRFCQNWDISKLRDVDRLGESAPPESIAHAAQQLGCKSVAFTYNDPVIFAEYAIDVAVACHTLGVQTVAVTAGYMTAQPRAELYRHIDAANVDLKGFTEVFYHKLCLGQLAPVLETLEYLHRETKVWLEVTTLLIPGENDDEKQLHAAADWFAEHLGPDVPWHFTAFHPAFKMQGTPSTPSATLTKARTIARSKGLLYVYTGNVYDPVGNSTRCPHCQRVVIERDRFQLGAWHLQDSHCQFCHNSIPGRFAQAPGTGVGLRKQVQLN